jgi:hypothetical protein
MLRIRLLFPICAMALLASSSAHASTILMATLTHDQEPGAGPLLTSTGDPRPLSFGTATFVLNDAMTQMTMLATVFNIDITGSQTPDANDNLVAAHIHVGPPFPVAPVRWGFFGSPDNDINPKQLAITPLPGGAVGGTFSSIWDLPEGNAGTTLATNLPGILAGLSYINFHTVQNGGGEIRGQLAVVPEPATLILVGSGMAAGLARRRARRPRRS